MSTTDSIHCPFCEATGAACGGLSPRDLEATGLRAAIVVLQEQRANTPAEWQEAHDALSDAIAALEDAI
jgi:hypothetical protein